MQDIQQQMQLIGELQRHLLPRGIPQPRGWRIAAHYSVGPWPGGDFYDVQRLSDGHLLVLVADASGSGGLAAVLVAVVRAVLHSCPLSSGVERLPFCPFRDPLIQPPHIVLGHLNRVLVENSLEEQFMTALCGVLNPRDGQLQFANAGHPLARWWRASSRTVQSIPDVSGIPLGLEPNIEYRQGRVKVESGDVLVWYSDGLTEAMDNQGELFGCNRLDDALQKSASQGAEAVKSVVLDRLSDFLHGNDPADDVTLLIVERL